VISEYQFFQFFLWRMEEYGLKIGQSCSRLKGQSKRTQKSYPVNREALKVAKSESPNPLLKERAFGHKKAPGGGF
jgi:hypothetical protein